MRCSNSRQIVVCGPAQSVRTGANALVVDLVVAVQRDVLQPRHHRRVDERDEALADATVIACEDTRVTRRLLHHLGIVAPRLVVVNDHTERDAIAAVILGGTSLFGGRGSIWGSLLGAVLITMIRNGMNLLEISQFRQMMAIGAVVIVAVWIDVIRRQRLLRSSP